MNKWRDKMVEIFVKGSALLLKGYELFHSIKLDYVYGFFYLTLPWHFSLYMWFVSITVICLWVYLLITLFKAAGEKAWDSMQRKYLWTE